MRLSRTDVLTLLMLALVGGGGGTKADSATAGQGSPGQTSAPAPALISGANVVIDGVEFHDAKVPDQNGAGIRAEGNGLTILNCEF